jgi:hypothetical protein
VLAGASARVGTSHLQQTGRVAHCDASVNGCVTFLLMVNGSNAMR